MRCLGLDFGDFTYQGDLTSNSRKDQYGAVLRLSWNISPDVNLVSTTGYWDLNIIASQDNDGSVISLEQNPYIEIDARQLTQEITLTADLTNKLDLILGGLYLQDNAKEPLEFVSIPSGIDSFLVSPEQDLESYSLYGQLRYQLTERLRLSAGIRYTNDTKKYTDFGSFFNGAYLGDVVGERSWDAVTPRFAVDYDVTDDITAFANVSRGFKAGGFSTFAIPIDDFDPEFVWNYEAGVKGTLFDNKARGGVTAFYADYTDLQQSVFGNEGGPISALPSIQNAASATVAGVEAEADVYLTNNFKLNAAVTWLDAEFDELSSRDIVFPELGVRDLSGNRLARAPEWQYNLGAEYSVLSSNEMELTLRADYQWQDKIYFSFYNHETISQDPYGLLNLSATLVPEAGGWEASAFMRNVFDEQYISNIYTTDLIVLRGNANIGEPRMYGLSISYDF